MVARILYILLAVLFFGIMIAIHEFGHFFTAKLFGIRVNEYSIGMGPAIFKRTRGETQYSLRAFPIGGYCAMEGEDEDTGDEKGFYVQKGWKKLIVLAMGSVMNFVLGLLIVVLLYSNVAAVRTPVISMFFDGFSVEGEEGLMVGDEILSVDGHRVLIFSDVQLFFNRNDGTGMDLVVRRDGQKVVLNDLPMERYQYTETDYGFGLGFGEVQTLGFFGRLKLAASQSVDFIRQVWMGLGDLITGRVGLSGMSGIIGVVDMVSEVGTSGTTALDGFLDVMYLIAFISVNLAVMNLLPLPALDGGRIIFVLINGVVYLFSRKTIPAKYEGVVHTVGLVLLMGLMIVVAVNDVAKIFIS